MNRCVAEADLVVSTGKVKPHYFAGWGGGAKGIFPGLGHDTDIRQNHKLKADPASSLGRADGNPCREDIEEAVRRLGRDTYLVNVAEAGATIVGAVAGDVVYAHREAVRLARPWCEVEAAPADVVIVSAPLPVSGSLYQASKLIPPAGLLLREGGVVVVAAECPEGTGPLQVVNEGIFELGVRRYLPAGATVLLVSGMDEATVRQTYATYAPDLATALARAREHRREGGPERPRAAGRGGSRAAGGGLSGGVRLLATLLAPVPDSVCASFAFRDIPAARRTATASGRFGSVPLSPVHARFARARVPVAAVDAPALRELILEIHLVGVFPARGVCRNPAREAHVEAVVDVGAGL